MSEDKTVQLKYSINSTGRGEFGQIQIQAEYFKLESQGPNHLRHPNHQPIMFSHQGGNSQNTNSPDIQVRPVFEETLDAYMQRIQLNTVESYRWNYNPHVINYVPEQYRTIVRSIIAVMAYYHTAGRSLEESTVLSLDNFGFYQGHLSLGGVNFRTSTIDTIVKDFKIFHDFLSGVFFRGQPTGVNDMDDLLDKMKYNLPSPIPYHYEEFLKYHVATMTYEERVRFMITCFDASHILTSGGVNHPKTKSYYAAVGALGDQSGWDNKINNITTPDPVYQTFANGGGSGSYDTRIGYRPDHITRISIVDVNLDLLRACRNILMHFGQNVNNLIYSDMDRDLTLMELFSDIFTNFHECLYNENLLFEVIAWKERTV